LAGEGTKVATGERVGWGEWLIFRIGLEKKAAKIAGR